MHKHKNTTTRQEPTLVGTKRCLELIFEDEASRPGLRTFLEWKSKGYVPFIKVGKRIFYRVDHVRTALEKRFTINSID